MSESICFAGEMSESQAKEVRIKEVDGWTLKILIEYIYTGEITVTEENVQVSEMIIFIYHKILMMVGQISLGLARVIFIS